MAPTLSGGPYTLLSFDMGSRHAIGNFLHRKAGRLLFLGIAKQCDSTLVVHITSAGGLPGFNSLTFRLQVPNNLGLPSGSVP